MGAVGKAMNWEEKVGKPLDKLGTYLVGGFHAMPREGADVHWTKRLPSQHRLYNAAGMFGFFMIGSYARDIMRGFNEKGETIEREDVLPPFRFLHKTLEHNPHSDDMHDRWNKVICQIIPATFGATGAILGSVQFFRNNTGYDQRAAALQKHAKDGTGDGLGAFQADDALAHYQSWPLRILAGVFATFSAASGLTVLYGMFLNSAFSFASNRNMFAGAAEMTGIDAFRKLTNTTGNTQFGPAQALDKRVISESKLYYERWAREAEKDPGYTPPEAEVKELQDRLIKEVLAPLFPEYTVENEDKMRAGVTKMFSQAWQKAQQSGKTPADVGKAAMDFFRSKFMEEVGEGETKQLKYRGSRNFIGTMHEYFGMSQDDLKKANLDNNGLVGKFSSVMLKPFGGDDMAKAFADAWSKKVDAVFEAMRGGTRR